MPRIFEYSTLDVFAETPLAGNQLAVFHDASGMTTEEMQAVAREMNLSETTFIVPGNPAEEAERGVRVRIFTTEEEFPFAGHPTLGTATWLYLNHPTLRGESSITLLFNVGPIVVHFAQPDTRPGVVATMRQNDPVFGAEHDRAEVAKLLSLSVDDLVGGAYAADGFDGAAVLHCALAVCRCGEAIADCAA